MTINLSAQREQFVRSLVQGGRYASEYAVIDAALRLLEERDELARLDVLRRELAVGIEQADRGELAPFDPEATLARIRARRWGGVRQQIEAGLKDADEGRVFPHEEVFDEFDDPLGCNGPRGPAGAIQPPRCRLARCQQPLVLVMRPDPEPDQAIGHIRGQGTIPRPHPHRPEPPDSLEMKRRTPRGGSQKLVVPIRHPLHRLGKPTVAVPEVGRREVIQSGRVRPARCSSRARSINASSRPALASRSICSSQSRSA